jgi:hypothetical protein
MFISIWLLPVQVVLCMVAIGSQAPGASAFHVKSQAAMQSQSHQQRPLLWPTNMYSSSSRLQSAKHGEPDDLEIVSASEEMSAEVQAELDASRPSEWMVMKKVGIVHQ